MGITKLIWHVTVGNCASSLIQGIEYYENKDGKEAIGLMHWNIGGYKPYDIDFIKGKREDSKAKKGI